MSYTRFEVLKISKTVSHVLQCGYVRVIQYLYSVYIPLSLYVSNNFLEFLQLATWVSNECVETRRCVSAKGEHISFPRFSKTYIFVPVMIIRFWTIISVLVLCDLEIVLL